MLFLLGAARAFATNRTRISNWNKTISHNIVKLMNHNSFLCTSVENY